MEINVNITPEQVNEAVAAAIIKSALGVELEKHIQAEVAKFSTSYNNPIDKIVARYIDESVRQIVQEQYGTQIKEWIAEKLTPEFTADLFNKLWESFKNRY